MKNKQSAKKELVHFISIVGINGIITGLNHKFGLGSG